ncbi:RtcB family protein [Pseudochryseolinea flava]|uniref:3'-phosphate/5'-hydroxy nucleic acid ligase n=1 Tax=Pseudochryseolinea flava TaxID=2059302 RepID=A0A364Y714_9BACT|nr:RtcB family protein [Pseudochryseolinea flava]RAW02896.1 RtcB family protein [Pseudochryseolinea flava]
MAKQKLDIKLLSAIDFPSDVARSVALNIMNRHFKHTPNDEKLKIIQHVLETPESYLQHATLGLLAHKVAAKILLAEPFEVFQLNDEPKHFDVFGSKHIEVSAINQMALAMRLPVAEKGALMPDAHQGYGLPIGGVFATKNAVVPYGVGMDIGCRMSLTILEQTDAYVEDKRYELKKALENYTHFGNDGFLDFDQHHDVLDHPDFSLMPLLKKLHGKAVKQLGSSGSGNHFVEFGVVTLYEGNQTSLPAGRYAALLSHSGSRSLGANIAQHYTNIAMNTCKLPREAKHLAWLDLNSEAGEEYWRSMNLAGEYAKACHDRIHKNLCEALGIQQVLNIENHHNFAWRERIGDDDYIVHRKGATPAAKDVLGIIPGSMTAAGYIVRGLGNDVSLNSAAHGAGRKMSRDRAKNSFTMSSLKKELQSKNVTLIGGGVDEAPLAYKDIDLVMKSQTTLVAIEGEFLPRVVRMAKD